MKKEEQTPKTQMRTRGKVTQKGKQMGKWEEREKGGNCFHFNVADND